MKSFSKIALLLVVGCWSSVVYAQSVDLTYQGETYTPPFYRGGAAWSYESIVSLLAIPQGAGNPDNALYRWTQDGRVLGNISGRGKSTMILGDTVFSKPTNIKVEIISPDDESTLAAASLTITPTSPSVLVYEKNPLYGFLFNNEVVGSYRMTQPEVTFSAFPLFFNASKSSESPLQYSWGSNAGDNTNSSSVTYRAPDNASGSANVGVEVSNKNTLKQKGEENFLVQFGHE